MNVRQSIWNALRQQQERASTTAELADRAQTSPTSARTYLNALLAAGIVERVKTKNTNNRRVHGWRLLKNSGIDAPLVNSRGEKLPEPLHETVWRTAKILKRFGADDLHRHVAMTRECSLTAVTGCIRALVRNGCLQEQGNGYVLVNTQHPYMGEAWFRLLNQRIEERGQKQVAAELGCSLTAVNLIKNGRYSANPARLGKRVTDLYAEVRCPHSNSVITMQQCRDTATAQAPTHNPIKLEQWRACQSCRHKPCAGQPKSADRQKNFAG